MNLAFQSEILLILVGAILSYVFKTLGEKKAATAIRDEIKDINESIQGIRELMIRNESILKDVAEMKVSINQLVQHNTKQDQEIALLKKH